MDCGSYPSRIFPQAPFIVLLCSAVTEQNGSTLKHNPPFQHETTLRIRTHRVLPARQAGDRRREDNTERDDIGLTNNSFLKS
jgi:hypothetical protein